MAQTNRQSLLIIFVLLLAVEFLQAGDSYITKLCNCGINDGVMKLSTDKKFVYVCNLDGKFAKIDAQSGEILDTMSLVKLDAGQSSTYDIVYNPNKLCFFDVDNSNNYLVCTSHLGSSSNFYIITYDLSARKAIDTVELAQIDHWQIPFYLWGIVKRGFTDSTVIIGTQTIVYKSENHLSNSGSLLEYNFITKQSKRINNIEKSIIDMEFSHDRRRILMPNPAKSLIL